MAQSIPTYYDNLKVERDATVAVIKASYRALAQKYHPDRNRAPEALTNMMLINQAWDALRDPERRARHDRWIASQEQQVARAPVGTPVRRSDTPRNGGKFVIGLCALAAIAVLCALVFLAKASGPIDEPMVTISAPVDMPVAERLRHGEMWGDRQETGAGPAVLEIDNAGGKVDAYVRMVRDGRIARSMYVHHGRSLSLEGLRLGKYIIKYKIVVDGKERAFQVRDTFALIQTPEEAKDGRYNKFNRSRITMFNLAGSQHTADEIALDQF